MANESITFLCPACGIKLTIPGNLAGVTGPCPTCRTQIQAPYPASVPLEPSTAIQPPPPPPVRPAEPVYQTPAPIYQAPPQQPLYQQPVQPPAPDYQSQPGMPQGYGQPAAPVYQSAATEPPPLPVPVVSTPVYQTDPPVYEPPPLQQIPPASAASPEPHTQQSPAVLRPEPRQLPSRSSHAEPVAKQMPEPSYPGGKSSKNSNPLPRHPRQKSRFARFMMGLIFLIASGAIVFGVLTILRNQSKEESLRHPVSGIPPRTIQPAEEPKPEPPSPPLEESVPALSVPEPEQPSIIEPPPELPEGLEPETPGQAATDLLEKFLTAKTLAERLPMMETRTPEAELAKSCLAGPLPLASNISVEASERNAVEQMVDFYHNVDFDNGKNGLSSHTILVRKRGSTDPKVVVDPFLDSYGGRLAAFAGKPTDKSQTFQVTIWPLAACYDEKVPNRDKKLTLKLLPKDDTKEIALAYFGKQSKIAQMLEDGTYSLSYGKAKACTVMLRWNQEDRPETPYLEAIDLKTLDWNP